GPPRTHLQTLVAIAGSDRSDCADWAAGLLPRQNTNSSSRKDKRSARPRGGTGPAGIPLSEPPTRVDGPREAEETASTDEHRMCPSCRGWQRGQGGAVRWFWKSARTWVLAGWMVGAAPLTASSLRAQQPDLLPRPETVQAPSSAASLFPGQTAPEQPTPMPDA